MPDQPLPNEYLAGFPNGKPDSLRQRALREALDNRKFEIDLYWKRAAYFWTFIAAAFAAYFVLQKDGYPSLVYVVTCLGFIFSLAWYFVNRGSKFWQQNWEMHVDLLEDDIAGPLYKTVLRPREYKLRDLTDAYPFSVSKINQILSLFVTFVWLILALRTVVIAWSAGTHFLTIGMVTALTSAGVLMLLKCVSTRKDDDQVKIIRRIRHYSGQ
jgi:hypothetical protein